MAFTEESYTNYMRLLNRIIDETVEFLERKSNFERLYQHYVQYHRDSLNCILSAVPSDSLLASVFREHAMGRLRFRLFISKLPPGAVRIWFMRKYRMGFEKDIARSSSLNISETSIEMNRFLREAAGEFIADDDDLFDEGDDTPPPDNEE